MSTSWRYPAVIAHRCGGALAPENTLAGLFIAARLGVKAVEFDVMLSADGVPVLIHDDTLERTSNGRGKVADTPLAELQQLDAGSFQHPAFAGERIPTLVETIDTCNRLGLAINLEIKPAPGTDQHTAEVICRTLHDHPVAAGLIFSSFSLPALYAAKAAAPQIPRAWLTGFPPEGWLAELAALEATALHCAARTVTPAVVEAAAAGGWAVACYTVNTAAEAEALRKIGVVAVFSDRPDRVS